MLRARVVEAERPPWTNGATTPHEPEWPDDWESLDLRTYSSRSSGRLCVRRAATASCALPLPVIAPGVLHHDRHRLPARNSATNRWEPFGMGGQLFSWGSSPSSRGAACEGVIFYK